MGTAMRNNKGFTLLEMLVVMAVFVIVIMITGSVFDTILRQTSKLFKLEESNIEGVLGLEMLRHDLQQAGVGLFTEVPPKTYDEALSAPAASYNDSTNHVPRPIVAGNNLATVAAEDSSPASSILAGTDYLVIKATTVARSNASQKWAYLLNATGTATISKWPSAAENFLTINPEYFVLLRKTFDDPPRTFIELNTSDNELWFRINSPALAVYNAASTNVYLAYGIDGNYFTFPFNRTDYFVARTNAGSNMPGICAPNTGILYKGTINQSDGRTTYIPLVDCVADMQVLFGWDINLDGMVDTWSNAGGSAVTGTGSVSQVQSAISQANNDSNEKATLNIRNCLKVVKVYLIVQDGKKDLSYTSASTVQMGDAGEGTLLRGGGASPAVYTLTSDMLNYRWKEYRIVIRPKNLLSNQ